MGVGGGGGRGADDVGQIEDEIRELKQTKEIILVAKECLRIYSESQRLHLQFDPHWAEHSAPRAGHIHYEQHWLYEMAGNFMGRSAHLLLQAASQLHGPHS